MKRYFVDRGTPSAIAVVLLSLAVIVIPETATANDATVPWVQFSESSGCAEPGVATPMASRKGQLGDSERVLGPFGTYFGRTVADIRDRQRLWTVPSSGGRTVYVHEAAYPAFQRVAQRLEEERQAGRVYPVIPAGAFYPRTVGGAYRISRHTMGIAIDLNASSNPFRDDGTLITDMPEWYVDVWREEGFCWGGDWQEIKDPMHFSWMGPTTESTVRPFMTPIDPVTNVLGLGIRRTSTITPFGGSVAAGRLIALGDVTGNGAVDVTAVRSGNDITVLEFASSTGGWNECSVNRGVIENVDPDADEIVWVDVDGDSRSDAVSITIDGSQLELDVATRRSMYENVQRLTVPLSVTPVAFAGADADRDRQGELWVFAASGDFEVVSLTSGAIVSAGTVDASIEHVAVADRHLDGRPEIFVMGPDDQVREFELVGTAWSPGDTHPSSVPSENVVSMVGGDHDGDGRGDVFILSTTGQVITLLGNTTPGVEPGEWYTDPEYDCVEAPLVWDGTFHDDDGSIFETDIERLADLDVTRGCNPPFNDAFCPTSNVTRGQMAAFLARILGLPSTDEDFFDDDDDSIFETDINRLAAAGITRGCNPPQNDRFCVGDPVTRQQMAAFLARALDLPSTDQDPFDDDDDSIFETDINRLAASGITRGCNPPTNDRFCPTDQVTRQQMAAFLVRADAAS